MNYPRGKITGVVLAGGLGRRLGGQDKGLLTIRGQPLIAYLLARLRPQVDALLISANRHGGEYAALGGCPVVPDQVRGFAGPLAGIAAAMAIVQTPYLVTVPCDSPLLVEDYVARLYQELMHSHAEIGVAQDQTIGLQPVFALIRCELLPGLLAFLECGERQVRKWYARHRMVGVDFSAHPEMFLNVNTPADRALLERWLEGPGFSLTDR